MESILFGAAAYRALHFNQAFIIAYSVVLVFGFDCAYAEQSLQCVFFLSVFSAACDRNTVSGESCAT